MSNVHNLQYIYIFIVLILLIIEWVEVTSTYPTVFICLLYSTDIAGLLICLPYLLVDGAVVGTSMSPFFNAVVCPCLVSLKPTFYITGYCGLLPHSLTGPPWLYADYVTCTQPRLVFEISRCRLRYRLHFSLGVIDLVLRTNSRCVGLVFSPSFVLARTRWLTQGVVLSTCRWTRLGSVPSFPFW